jgi:hypothetical protein
MAKKVSVSSSAPAVRNVTAGWIAASFSTCMRTAVLKSRIADMRCIRYPPCSAFMSNGIRRFFSGFDIKISSRRAVAEVLPSTGCPGRCRHPLHAMKLCCAGLHVRNFAAALSRAYAAVMAACAIHARIIDRWPHISFMPHAACRLALPAHPRRTARHRDRPDVRAGASLILRISAAE